MTTIYNRIQNNFTQISNAALLDVRLSGKAYKLYAYMCYRIGTSAAWEFNKKEIAKHFKEGRDSIYQAEKELLDVGFLRKMQKRTGGKFSKNDYEIFAEPIDSDSKPFTENPETVMPETEESVTVNQSYSNKEEINKDLNNKEISFPAEAKKDEKEKKEDLDKEKEVKKIEGHCRSSQNLSEKEKIELIISYFDLKGYKSCVQTFLLYHKLNIHETFKKLPYFADIWEGKFEEMNKLSQNKTKEIHITKEEEDAYKFMEAKFEYAKRHFKNPERLTEEEIKEVRQEMDNY